MLPGVMPFMYGSHPIACRLDEIGIVDYEFHPFEGEGHAFYFSPVVYTLIEEKFDTCFNITRDFLYRHLQLPSSMPESNEQKIQIYPNPAVDYITVCVGEWPQGKSFGLLVMDVNGKILTEKRLSAQKVSIDVSQWPSGVYYVWVEQEGARSGRKFVKQ